MGRRAQSGKLPKSRDTKPPRARATPLGPEEIHRTIVDLASVMAPADLGSLLTHADTLRSRPVELGGAAGVAFGARLDLVLACLRDHVAGACPQIPFHTISLLAAAVAYMATKLDLVPDFLPHDGTLDDAAVVAVACTLAADGLDRYCTWKGITLDHVTDTASRLAGAPRRKVR